MKMFKKTHISFLFICLLTIIFSSRVNAAVQSASGVILFEDEDPKTEGDFNDFALAFQVSAHYQNATGKIYNLWILIDPKAAGATHDLQLKLNKNIIDQGGTCLRMTKSGSVNLSTNQSIYNNLSEAFINCPDLNYINTQQGRGMCKGQPTVIQCTNLGQNPTLKLPPDTNGDNIENLVSKLLILRNNTLNLDYVHDSKINNVGNRWLTLPNVGTTTERSHFFNLILKPDYEANIDGANRSMATCDPRTNNFFTNSYCNELIKSYFVNYHTRALLLSDGDARFVNKFDFNPTQWHIKKNTGPGSYSNSEGYNLLNPIDFIAMVLEGSFARAGRNGLCLFVDCLTFEPPSSYISDQEGYACAGGCSDTSITSESACLAVGTCSDPTHTSRSACEAAGTCIGGSFISNAEACRSSGNIWKQSNTWTITNSYVEPFCSSSDLYCHATNTSSPTCQPTTGSNGEGCDEVNDCASSSMSCIDNMAYYAPGGSKDWSSSSMLNIKNVCTDNQSGAPCLASASAPTFSSSGYGTYDAANDTCASGLHCLSGEGHGATEYLSYTCTETASDGLCTQSEHCPEKYLCSCKDAYSVGCNTESYGLERNRCFRNIWTYDDAITSSLAHDTQGDVVEGDFCEFFAPVVEFTSSAYALKGNYAFDYSTGIHIGVGPITNPKYCCGTQFEDGYCYPSPNPYSACTYSVFGADYLTENGTHVANWDISKWSYYIGTISPPTPVDWFVQVSCTDGSSCIQRNPTDNFKQCTFLP